MALSPIPPYLALLLFAFLISIIKAFEVGKLIYVKAGLTSPKDAAKYIRTSGVREMGMHF